MSIHETRECPVHGPTKFAKHKNGNAQSTFRCSKCAAERVALVVNAKRDRAYREYGSACTVCGYDRCREALDWHHLDASAKEFEPSKVFSRAWDTIKKELDKCILLCANCHREVHHNGLVT